MERFGEMFPSPKQVDHGVMSKFRGSKNGLPKYLKPLPSFNLNMLPFENLNHEYPLNSCSTSPLCHNEVLNFFARRRVFSLLHFVLIDSQASNKRHVHRLVDLQRLFGLFDEFGNQRFHPIKIVTLVDFKDMGLAIRELDFEPVEQRIGFVEHG